MTMSLTIERRGQIALVRLGGEIDLSNSMEIRREISACLQDRWDVVVDLAAVGYIDSSGLAGLVEGYQLAKRYGIRFALAAVSPAALRVLKLARLDTVFALFDDVEGALAP